MYNVKVKNKVKKKVQMCKQIRITNNSNYIN